MQVIGLYCTGLALASGQLGELNSAYANAGPAGSLAMENREKFEHRAYLSALH